MKRSAVLAFTAMAVASACGPPDEVEIQPLTSLEQLSAEARAGLPTVSGAWTFAGWELAENDSARLEAELPRFGVLSLATQKRDSLAGQYVSQGGSAPLYGEVRRDSVIALVGVFGPGDMRYLAGRVSRDTVWMELSSLAEPGSWPSEGRAAFIRGTAGEPFVRLRGALPPPPPPVAVVDSAAPAPATAPVQPPVSAGADGVAPAVAPRVTPIPAPRPSVTPAPDPVAPAVTPRVTPAPAPRAPTVPRPRPQQEPAPQPTEVEEEEPPIPLLGDPAIPEAPAEVEP